MNIHHLVGDDYGSSSKSISWILIEELFFSCLDDRGLIQKVALTTILYKRFFFLPKQIPSKLDLGI
jgi:hypothetical protein